jgi:hypothetical protein
MSVEMLNQITEKLEELGYHDPYFKVLADGRIAWIRPFFYTSAIVVAEWQWIDDGCKDRWCYEDRSDAEAALDKWAIEGGPEPSGWHRHPSSGRRRPRGNAELEYVNL